MVDFRPEQNKKNTHTTYMLTTFDLFVIFTYLYACFVLSRRSSHTELITLTLMLGFNKYPQLRVFYVCCTCVISNFFKVYFRGEIATISPRNKKTKKLEVVVRVLFTHGFPETFFL